MSYHLRKGEQRSEAFIKLNAQGLVPALEIDGYTLSQSLAIIEYLDEMRPDPALLPEDPVGRARVRALSMMIGCDIHPLNNLRVLDYLQTTFDAGDAGVATWFNHWVVEGFQALENRLISESETGLYCHGDTVTMADICLVAQVVNNRRFNVDMAPFPRITQIHERCLTLEAFQKAMPAVQPDAE